MKIIILILFISISPAKQENLQVDSIMQVLEDSNEEKKVLVYKDLCWKHRDSSPSKALEYGLEALKLEIGRAHV